MIKKGKKKDQTFLGPVRNSRIEEMLFLSDKTFPVKNVLEPTLANDVIDLDQEKAPADLEGVDLTKGKCFLSIDEKKGIAVYQTAVDLLKKYWEHDKFPEFGETIEETHCIKTLSDSYEIRDGRVYVSPLWRVGQPEPGLNNYFYSNARLTSILKGMSQEDFDCIDKIFADYLEMGITEEVEVKDIYADAIYWPHFPVYQPNSPTTPTRPVMDGKAKCFGGKSINDKCFLPGPNLMCNLTQVLMRFRQYDVAFTGDISKMFLKILVPEKYRKYNRFIWVAKDKVTRRIFQFTGQLFGNNGSPTVSIWAVQKTATDHKDKYPRAAETVMESTVVDDHLDSCPTDGEVITILQSLLDIYGKIGLKLGKVSTNSKTVAEWLPEEFGKSGSLLDFERYYSTTEYAPGTIPKLPSMRTLGQVWDMVSDQFSYKTYVPDEIIKWTKVACLSQAHKLFDPLGFAIPIILESKLILRDVFIAHPEWKDELDPPELERWKKWLVNLPLMSELRFNRVLKPGLPETFDSVQLHVYADASKEAFAAVAYIRVEYNNGNDVYTNFVHAKSSLAPKKPVRTIPKLELMAIELAARLAIHCAEPLKIATKDIVLWSDSKTALQWLNMDINSLQVLCHNYCKKTVELVPLEQIKWVPGLQNPADVATRSHTVPELTERLDLWTLGASFLKSDKSHWPILQELEKTEEVLQEVKKEFKLFASSFVISKLEDSRKDFFQLKWFYTFDRIKRIFSYVVRFLRKTTERINLRRRGKIPLPLSRPPIVVVNVVKHMNIIPTRRDLVEAECRIIYIHQQTYFAKEINYISKRNGLQLSNKLAKLGPVLVPHQGEQLSPNAGKLKFLRLGGRVKYADHLQHGTRFPLVLFDDCDLTRKIIQHYHGKVLKHTGGIKCLTCELHRSYWIAGSLNSIKRVLRECEKCRKARPRPMTQKMAPLPNFRIPGANEKAVTPFQCTALDAAGPWVTSQLRGQKRTKRWLLIFRCTLYGAVHLEMLWKMDTDSFLMALDRFTSQHRIPERIICDNGTNFVGGCNELSKMWDEIDQTSVMLERLNIIWDFSPPEAPWFNGLSERMVGAAKNSLKTALPELLTDEVLETTFKSVQGMLNNRPIAYNGGDPKDLESLTPNHFLMSGNIASDLAPLVDTSPSMEKRFRFLVSLKDKFWRRFVHELVPILRATNKWRSEKPAIAVDDIVVVLDEEGNRLQNRFPLGRIISINFGKDGLPRRALVRMQKGDKSVALNRLSIVLPANKVNYCDESELHFQNVNDDKIRKNRRKKVTKKAVHLCFAEIGT